MSHYTIEELIARWKKEDLSVEQVIGQLLLLAPEQQQRLRELARRSVVRARCDGGWRTKDERCRPSSSVFRVSTEALPALKPVVLL